MINNGVFSAVSVFRNVFGQQPKAKSKKQDDSPVTIPPLDKSRVARGLYIGFERTDGIGLEVKTPVSEEAKDAQNIAGGVLGDEIVGVYQQLLNIVNNPLNGLSAHNKHNVKPADFPKDGERVSTSFDDKKVEKIGAGTKENPLRPGPKDRFTGGDIENGGTVTRPDPLENHFAKDGKTYDLTLEVGGILNQTGAPEVIYLQDDMELASLGKDENGKDIFFRKVYYIDPKDGKTKEGVYYEVSEPLADGTRGVNGVIVPDNLLPTMIVKVHELDSKPKDDNTPYFKTRWSEVGKPPEDKYFQPKEAWFIGVDESVKRLDPRTTIGLNLDTSA